MLATEAAKLRQVHYTLDEVYEFIRSRARDGNRAVFEHSRMTNDILRQLRADGYTIREQGDGWEVKWPEPQELEGATV